MRYSYLFLSLVICCSCDALDLESIKGGSLTYFTQEEEFNDEGFRILLEEANHSYENKLVLNESFKIYSPIKHNKMTQLSSFLPKNSLLNLSQAKEEDFHLKKSLYLSSNQATLSVIKDAPKLKAYFEKAPIKNSILQEALSPSFTSAVDCTSSQKPLHQHSCARRFSNLED